MNIIQLNVDAELKALLQRCELPIDDIQNSAPLHFYGIHKNGELIACVGLETYGEVAMLRSLAVRADHRKLQLGSALVRHAEETARKQGINYLYLLTETAPRFFSRLGYALADRQQAPSAIKNTAQFAGLCPDSASLMRKPLI